VPVRPDDTEPGRCAPIWGLQPAGAGLGGWAASAAGPASSCDCTQARTRLCPCSPTAEHPGDAPWWWSYRPVAHSMVSLRLPPMRWSGISDLGCNPPGRRMMRDHRSSPGHAAGPVLGDHGGYRVPGVPALCPGGFADRRHWGVRQCLRPGWRAAPARFRSHDRGRCAAWQDCGSGLAPGGGWSRSAEPAR
jgi:hypothetical protein